MRIDMLGVLVAAWITAPSLLSVCNVPKIMIPQCEWIRWKKSAFACERKKVKGGEGETVLVCNLVLCFGTCPSLVPSCVLVCVSLCMCLCMYVAQEGWPRAPRRGGNARPHTLLSLDSLSTWRKVCVCVSAKLRVFLFSCCLWNSGGDTNRFFLFCTKLKCNFSTTVQLVATPQKPWLH